MEMRKGKGPRNVNVEFTVADHWVFKRKGQWESEMPPDCTGDVLLKKEKQYRRVLRKTGSLADD